MADPDADVDGNESKARSSFNVILSAADTSKMQPWVA